MGKHNAKPGGETKSRAYSGKHRADSPHLKGREATVTGDPRVGYSITSGRTEQQRTGAGEAGENRGGR